MLFLTGLAAFLVNIVSGIWIKYKPYTSVSIASTACVVAALVYLLLLLIRWSPYLTGSTKTSRKTAVSVRAHFVFWEFISQPRNNALQCTCIHSLRYVWTTWVAFLMYYTASLRSSTSAVLYLKNIVYRVGNHAQQLGADKALSSRLKSAHLILHTKTFCLVAWKCMMRMTKYELVWSSAADELGIADLLAYDRCRKETFCQWAFRMIGIYHLAQPPQNPSNPYSGCPTAWPGCHSGCNNRRSHLASRRLQTSEDHSDCTVGGVGCLWQRRSCPCQYLIEASRQKWAPPMWQCNMSVPVYGL